MGPVVNSRFKASVFSIGYHKHCKNEHIYINTYIYNTPTTYAHLCDLVCFGVVWYSNIVSVPIKQRWRVCGLNLVQIININTEEMSISMKNWRMYRVFSFQNLNYYLISIFGILNSVEYEGLKYYNNKICFNSPQLMAILLELFCAEYHNVYIYV